MPLNRISISQSVAASRLERKVAVFAALKNGQDVGVHQFLDSDRIRTTGGAFYPIETVLYFY